MEIGQQNIILPGSLPASLSPVDPKKQNEIPKKILEPKLEQKNTKPEMSFFELFKWALLILGPVASAVVHSIAAFGDLFYMKDFEKNPIRQFLDKTALNFSKIILTLSCGINGFEAWKKNRLWEALSRFIEPIFIVAEKRTEDLGLARGIGLGISQLVGSQEGIYNEVVKNKLGIDLTNKDEKCLPTMGQDHDFNTLAFCKIAKEIFTNGLGSSRRFLTGFTLANTKEKLGNFCSQFSLASLKEFISSQGDLVNCYEKFCEKSGLSNIQELCKGDENKDKGHTTALSGYTMILGSLLGYLDKSNKGFLYKLGGTMRNLGGVMADVSIFGHKDPYYNASALFLIVNTFMDIFQRFIPSQLKHIILPWSNISMAAYNIGCGLYLNRSYMKSNHQDHVKTYDTDLSKTTKSTIALRDQGAQLATMAA